MKKKILLTLLILLNIFIIFRLFALIPPLLFPEKVMIEDVWTDKNRYVGNIITNKGNIYYIDYSNFKNRKRSLKDSSNYLLNISEKRNEKINHNDFELIKESLKNIKEEHIEHIKNNNNFKCEFNKYSDNDRLLIFYDYDNNKKIIIGGKKACEYRNIIDVVQEYYIFVNDV